MDSRVQNEIPEEGRRTYWPKRCEYKKDEVNSPNILNNNNISHLFCDGNEYHRTFVTTASHFIRDFFICPNPIPTL